MTKLYYQGHGSVRITTTEGKIIYIDPYAGDGYDLPADLILVSHQHGDHNQTDLIAAKTEECRTITQDDALEGGKHNTFELGYLKVEAVEAANKNHDPKQCVGFILTFSDGIQLYLSCDTSKTEQMAGFAARNFDYAFLCSDGVYNMSMEEASECAALIKAKHSTPYHMAPGELFNRELADKFEAEGKLILAAGEEITL
ncbi:MAG: MBL fold metallo-hydrolase [Oscillospiraceae bacterium]|nr:MBL fold metallo-hydrolase [Oscillospiraceae bacterium]